MAETEETSLFTSVVPEAGALGVWDFSGMLERKRGAAGRDVMIDWRAKETAGRIEAPREARAMARIAFGANIANGERFIEL